MMNVSLPCSPVRSTLQVLLEIKHLILQFEKGSSPARGVKRAVMFLQAQGYQKRFEDLEQELRDCLVQLSAILNMTHFTSKVVPQCSVTTAGCAVVLWCGSML
jgi:hypothetical protein